MRARSAADPVNADRIKTTWDLYVSGPGGPRLVRTLADLAALMDFDVLTDAERVALLRSTTRLPSWAAAPDGLRAEITAWLGEAKDFDPRDHPRDRRGRFADKPGLPDVKPKGKPKPAPAPTPDTNRPDQAGRWLSESTRKGAAKAAATDEIIGKIEKPEKASKIFQGASLEDDNFPEDTAAWLFSTFERTDWPGGLTTRLNPSTHVDDDEQVTVKGWVLDADKNEVGQFTRIIRPGATMTNYELKLEPHVQGQGFAEAFYRRSEEAAQREGVQQVRLHADLDVGGYAWARRGFGWDRERETPRTARQAIDDWGMAARNNELLGAPAIPPAAHQAIQGLLDGLTPTGEVTDWDQVPTPGELAAYRDDIRWTETTAAGVEIPMWPGKKMLLGEGVAWRGMKPIMAGFETKSAAADWNRRVMAHLADGEATFVPGDSFHPHDGTTSDLNVLLVDLLLGPDDGETKSRFRATFARVGGFDPDEHPRDRHGRFLDKPEVILPGGKRGKAVSVDDSGDVTVAREGGGTTVASAESLVDPEKEQPPPPVIQPKPEPGFVPTAPKAVMTAVEAAKARDPAQTGRKMIGPQEYVSLMLAGDPTHVAATRRIESAEKTIGRLRQELDQGYGENHIPALMESGIDEPTARGIAEEQYPLDDFARESIRNAIATYQRQIGEADDEIAGMHDYWLGQFERDLRAQGRQGQRTLIHTDAYARDGGPSDGVMADLDAVIEAGKAVEAEAQKRALERARSNIGELRAEEKTVSAAADARAAELRAGQFEAATGIGDYQSWRESMLPFLDEYEEQGDEENAERTRNALLRMTEAYYSIEIDRSDPKLKALTDRQAELLGQVAQIRIGKERMLAQARREVLAEIRPMGGPMDIYPTWSDPAGHVSSNPATMRGFALWKGEVLRGGEVDEELQERIDRALGQAHDAYPAEWNAKLAASPEAPTGVTVTGRGFAGRDGTIGLSLETPPWEGAADELQVATHELGHFMERAVEGLRVMEWAYHWKRTTREVNGRRVRDGKNRVTSIYGGSREVGSQDEFATHYVGKVYRDSPTSSWELFTMASESVLAGAPHVTNDDETAAWALGLIATL